MSDEPKLKSCPCCGTENVHVYQANNDKYKTYQVKCRKCGLRICKPTRLEVITAWNRRAEPEERTAKATRKPEAFFYRCECGYGLCCEKNDMNYCPHCGARLEWDE